MTLKDLYYGIGKLVSTLDFTGNEQLCLCLEEPKEDGSIQAYPIDNMNFKEIISNNQKMIVMEVQRVKVKPRDESKEN